MIVEIEVEYVRTEKIQFEYNPDERNLGTANFPMVEGQFLRYLQFYMHHDKDLVRHERPRLISWRGVMDDELEKP